MKTNRQILSELKDETEGKFTYRGTNEKVVVDLDNNEFKRWQSGKLIQVSDLAQMKKWHK